MKKFKKLLAGLLSFAMVASTLPMMPTSVSAALVDWGYTSGTENNATTGNYYFNEDFEDGTYATAFAITAEDSRWTQTVEDGAMKFTWAPGEDETRGVQTLLNNVINATVINMNWGHTVVDMMEFGFDVKLNDIKSDIPELFHYRAASSSHGASNMKEMSYDADTQTMFFHKEWAGTTMASRIFQDTSAVLPQDRFVSVRIYFAPSNSDYNQMLWGEIKYTNDDGETVSETIFAETLQQSGQFAGRIITIYDALLSVDDTNAVEGDSFYIDNVYLKRSKRPHYTITWDYNYEETEGVNKTSSGVAAKSSPSVSLPTEPTRASYEFMGWYDENGVQFLGGDVSALDYDSDDAITFTAKWEQAFNVTLYDKDTDGNWAEVETLTTSTDSIILPTRPNSDGMTFDGWYTDDTLTEKFTGTGLTGDTSVYAGYRDDYVMYVDFENNTYPSGFDTPAQSDSAYQRWSNALVTGADGNTVMQYTVDRTKPFNGTSNQTIFSTSLGDFVGSSNANIKGKSVEMGVEISYGDSYTPFYRFGTFTLGDGWGTVASSENTYYGSGQIHNMRFAYWNNYALDIRTLQGPVKLTYNWDINADGTLNTSTMTIRVQAETTNGTVDKTLTNTYARSGTLTSFATEQYRDYVVYGTDAALDGLPATGSLSLDNIYIKIAKQSTLNFEVNGGTLPDGAESSITKGGTWTIDSLPTPTKTDSVFKGWWTLDGTESGDWGEEIVLGDEVDGEITVYAKWETGYTISLMDTVDDGEEDADGDGFVVDSTIVVKEGESTTLPVLATKNGEIFSGWYLDADYTRVFDGTGVTTSIPVYAKYGNDDGYLVWVDFENNTYPSGFDTPAIAEANQRWSNALVTDEDGNTVMQYTVDRTKEFATDASGTGIKQTAWSVDFSSILSTADRANKIVEMGYTIDLGDGMFSAGDTGTNTFVPIGIGHDGWGWTIKNGLNNYGNSISSMGFVCTAVQSSSLYFLNMDNVVGPMEVKHQLKFDESGTPIGSSKTITVIYTDTEGETHTVIEDMNDNVRTGNIISWAIEQADSNFVFDPEKATTDESYRLTETGVVTLDNLYVKELTTSTITYDTQGGTLPDGTASTYVGAGTYLAPSLPTPEKENYVFRGWYTDAACTAGNEFVSGDLVEGDITIYAKWVQGVTIKFMDKNADGEWEQVNKIEAETGDVITLPTLDSNDEGIFYAWYLEPELENIFAGDNITGSMEVYAGYRNDYLVLVDFENNTYPEGFNTPEVSAGAAYQRWSNELVIDENGNTVMQYTVDRTKPFDGTTKQTVWNVDLSTVLSKTDRANKIVEMGYTIDLGDGMFSSGDLASQAFVPIGFGNDGWGWSLKNTGVNQLKFICAADTSKVPTINKNNIDGAMEVKHEVTFDASGNPIGSTKSLTVTYTNASGDEITTTVDMNDNTRYNNLISWAFEAANDNFVFDPERLSEDDYILEEIGVITLDNLYVKEIPTIKLSYDANGGSLASGVSDTYVARETFVVPALPTPTRSGYAFAGWAYADGTMVDETDEISEDTTIYAQWVESNTIVFMDNSTGSWVEVDRIEVMPSETTALPTLATTTDGKAFEGWYTDETLATRYTADEIADGTTTVYAKYRTDYLYYVDFENNTYPTGFDVGTVSAGASYQRWSNELENDGENTMMTYTVDRNKLFDGEYSQTLWNVSNLVPQAALAGKSVEMGMTIDVGDGLANLKAETFGFGTSWGHSTIVNGVNYYNGSINTTVFQALSSGAYKVSDSTIASPIEVKYIYSFDDSGNPIAADRKITVTFTNTAGDEVSEVYTLQSSCSTGAMFTKAVELANSRFVFDVEEFINNEDYELVNEIGTIKVDNFYVKALGEEDNVTLTFDTMGGTMDDDDAVTGIGSIILGTLPVPEKDGCTFMGWYFKDASGNWAEKLNDNDSVSATATVYALWQADPAVKAYTPSGSDKVSTNPTITVEFDSVMSASTLTTANIEIWKISDSANTQIAPNSYSVTSAANPTTMTTTVTVALAGKLEADTTYKVVVKGGETGVANTNGVMAEDYGFTFATKELKLFVTNVGMNFGTISAAKGKSLTITYDIVNEEAIEENYSTFMALMDGSYNN